MTTHYFSPDASAPLVRRTIEVTLAGKAVKVTTANGMFSPQQVDKGTAILLGEKTIVDDAPASGNILDLGCGWGPIALTLAMLRPDCTVYAVDVNAHALTVCSENAAALGIKNLVAAAPEQLPSNLRFEALWSNPPIRVGKQVLHDMLRLWLPRLVPGGHADLVVQKNLGADTLQSWISDELNLPVVRLNTHKGFRLLRATHL